MAEIRDLKMFKKCPTCNGRGWFWARRRNGNEAWGVCPSCHAFGVVLEEVAAHVGLKQRTAPTAPPIQKPEK